MSALVPVHRSGSISHDWLTKRAGADFFSYFDSFKPKQDHSLIHLIAMGASDTYGSNRNADAYPRSHTKIALVDPKWDKIKVANGSYHTKSASTFTDEIQEGLLERFKTFEKFAKVYKHHKNKPQQGDKVWGEVKAAAYNDPMDRVELLIEVDNNEWKEDLEKLANNESIPFSMACVIDPAALVTTSRGLKAIANVHVGDVVLTHKNRWQRVSAITRNRYEGKTVCISVSNSPFNIDLTANHPMLAIRTAALINTAEKKEDLVQRPEWIQAGDLQKGDILLYLPTDNYPNYRSIANPHIAAALGEVIMGTDSDPGTRALLGSYLTAEHAPLFLGIFGSTPEVRSAFLGAIFDSDDCEEGDGEILIPFEDAFMALYVCDLLAGIDVYANIKNSELMRSSGEKINGYVITVPVIDAAALSNFSSHVHKLCAEYEIAHNNSPARENIFIPAVISNISYGEASGIEVYNIEVENDHSYVVNGLISHNCKVPIDVCLAPDTEVITEYGIKKISKITKGERVLTHVGNLNSVTRIFHTEGRQDGKKITLNHFCEYIEATNNHPFFVLSAREATSNQRKYKRKTYDNNSSHTRQDRELQHSAMLTYSTQRIPTGIEGYSAEFVAAEDLTTDDFCLVPVRSSSTTAPALDPWLIGLYLGDGHVSGSRRGRKRDGEWRAYCAVWTLGFDKKAILEKLVKTLANYGLQPKVREYKNAKAWSVSAHSRWLAEELLKFGRTQTKHIHVDAFTWDTKDKIALIAGWLDADGSQKIYQTTRGPHTSIRGATVLPELMKGIRQLGLDAGLPFCVSRHVLSSSWSKSASYYCLYLSTRYAKTVSACSSYMQDTFTKAIVSKPRVENFYVEIDGTRYFAIRISKIEDIVLQETYNLEVENDESYVLLGASVHNCSYCGHKAKNRSEYCEHLTKESSSLLSDGSIVAAINEQPTFFDISRVTRPADRIAWSLTKAASALVRGADLALDPEFATFPDPAVLADNQKVAAKLNTYSKAAEMEKRIAATGKLGPLSLGVSPGRRTAQIPTDKVASVIRELHSGLVCLPLETFATAIFGNNPTTSQTIKEAEQYLPNLFEIAGKSDHGYSVATNIAYDSQYHNSTGMMSKVSKDLQSQHGLDIGRVRQRAIENCIKLAQVSGKVVPNDPPAAAASQLLNQYAGYKLAFLQHVRDNRPQDFDAILELAIAQNHV